MAADPCTPDRVPMPPAGLALVVDDSRTMRSILARLLAGLGWASQGAGNGREALDLLEAGCRPDLVLVDWNMPLMNGLDFVSAVRANPDYAAIPLIMVSTESELEQIVHALEAGADEYIVKPFTPDALAHKIDVLILDGATS